MDYRLLQYRKIIKFQNIRASTKVWTVQVKLLYKPCLKENNKRIEITNWIIREVLN